MGLGDNAFLWLNSWSSTAGMLLIFILWLFLWLTRREVDEAERRTGIPAAGGALPLLGHLPQVFKLGVDDFEKKWLRKKKSKLLLSWFGNSPMITVTDPEVLKHVLVKEFSNFHDRPRRNYQMTQPPINKGLFFNHGDHWKRIRTIITPTFSTGKLKGMNPDINRYSENLADKMEKLAKSKEKVEIKRLYEGFTLDTISATAFGLDVDCINNPDGPFIKNMRSIFEKGIGVWRRIFFTLGNIFPTFIPVVRYFKMDYFDKDHLDFFIRHCQAMIEDRKTRVSQRKDFLQLMVDAELEDKSTTGPEVCNVPNKRLTNDEVVAQVFMLYLAGHETTANTLTFVSYELALNQEVQDRVIQEIQDQIGEKEPTYENTNKLKYMDQVIMETLRMFPPLTRLYREIQETVTIGNYTFPKGWTVVVPVFSIHRDPEYWPDPERFDPGRFENPKSTQNKFFYIPFGQGPRICLGMRLALLELKVSLVHVLKRVRLVPCEETQMSLKPITHKGTLISVERPIQIGLQLRQNEH